MTGIDRDSRTPVRARIGIPTATSHALLFVDESAQGWDPWWRSLLEFLLGIADGATRWTRDEARDLDVGDVSLSAQQQVALLQFLRSAPTAEIAGHRTLRRAVSLPDEATPRITLLLFRGGRLDAEDVILPARDE